jgi:large subunit ribosomal protein L41
MHPTAPLFRSIRRLALNTKQAGKDYYKGNRTGSMGSHTKYGGYIVDPKKTKHLEMGVFEILKKLTRISFS